MIDYRTPLFGFVGAEAKPTMPTSHGDAEPKVGEFVFDGGEFAERALVSTAAEI